MGMTIGETLKSLRIQANFSVKQVSEFLTSKGFRAGANTIYSWENNNSQPTPDALMELCYLYEVEDIMKTFGYGGKDKDSVNGEQTAAQPLLAAFHKLNDRGQGVAVERVEELTEIPKYTTKPTAPAKLSFVNEDNEEYTDDLAPDVPTGPEIPHYTQKSAAGLGNYLDDGDYEMVSFRNTPAKANIAVSISGDSMEPRYYDGDTVFVETESVLNDGEIGIFCYNGSAYIKKLSISPPALVSLNKKYPSIEIKEHDTLYTLGRVLGVAER